MGIPKKYNVDTATQAAGFTNWFRNDTFLFWLSFFYKIMPDLEILQHQLQKIHTDAIKIQEAINFQHTIQEVRDNLPPIDESADENDMQNTRRRRRCGRENLHLSAREICDTIVFQIQDRFEFKNHLSGAALFVTEKYDDFKKKLPESDIEKFCAAFPMVDKKSLITELSVFYGRPEFRENNIVRCLKTLKFLIPHGLDAVVFKEVSKVLKILITVPMTSAETERCFSTLKLIKTYLRIRCLKIDFRRSECCQLKQKW